MSDFDVFLSHNSKDKPAVRALAEALRARGLKVWLDEWELIPGRPWQEALEEIIETVPCTAVLVGEAGLGPWEIPEMRAALSEFVKRGSPVIPVLLPGAQDAPKRGGHDRGVVCALEAPGPVRHLEETARALERGQARRPAREVFGICRTATARRGWASLAAQ
ncbi:MAG: toll/interleukin-1 receptor domain-containing protein [bacterium]|nr:toll/interleukin-1 receptor domain-containing protein [bacterium]